MMREVVIEPTHVEHVPESGEVERTYHVGRRFRLTLVQPMVGGFYMLSALQRWSPKTPTWDDLNKSERVDYRLARNAFAQVIANMTGNPVHILERDDE